MKTKHLEVVHTSSYGQDVITDGWKDGQTNANLYAPHFCGWGIKLFILKFEHRCLIDK